MAKFAALEKAQGAASGSGAGASGSGGGGSGGGSGGSGGSPPKLTEEELVKAVGGGHASFNHSRSAGGTDFSLVEEQNFEKTQRLKPRGALIGGLTGTDDRVTLVEEHVAPEELDACDAAATFARLRAGRDFAPFHQREAETNGKEDSSDASDPSKPATEPIRVGKDVVMVELKGVDAYTRERIIEGLAASIPPHRKEAFLGKVMQAMRLCALEGRVGPCRYCLPRHPTIFSH